MIPHVTGAGAISSQVPLTTQPPFHLKKPRKSANFDHFRLAWCKELCKTRGRMENNALTPVETTPQTDAKPVRRVREYEKRLFRPVFDSRGRKVKRLQVRNGRYYGLICVRAKLHKVALTEEDGSSPSTVTRVKELLEAKTQELKNNPLARLGHSKAVDGQHTFGEYVKHYLAWVEECGAKRSRTVAQERWLLNSLAEAFGTWKLTDITRKNLNDFVAMRKQQGAGPRTCNLHVMALHALLKFARSEGQYPRGVEMPTDDWKPLVYRAPKRALMTQADLEAFIAEALIPDKYKNGRMLADYVLLLAYSGARKLAGQSVLWSDVDWQNEQLHLRNNKFGKHHIIDFNPKLKEHLKDMATRRIDGTDNLFPTRDWGTNNGGRDMRFTFELVKKNAKVSFRLHDLRHYFISWCVMSGIDYMTIARWAGHADGGMLIGKVYGHLAQGHARAAAAKVKLGGISPESVVAAKPISVPTDLSSLSQEEKLTLLRLASALLAEGLGSVPVTPAVVGAQ